MTQSTPTRAASREHHLPFEARHVDEVEWETIRWPGESGKMLFHPRPERPTEPNAGILRLEPGAHHPEHYHGFAQVWYILSGDYEIDGKMYGPGNIVQYPGPTTTERPIYADRFNMKERRPIMEERVDR
jgi:hypothetical protein